MASRKHTVITDLDPNVNVTMNVTYNPDGTNPYTIGIVVINAAGRKYTMSGIPRLSMTAIGPESTAKASKATKTPAK